MENSTSVQQQQHTESALPFQNSWNLGPARVPVDSKAATNQCHLEKDLTVFSKE